MKTQIWSSGGGVQSSAIAALILSGKLDPPDLAVIIDTEYEASTTWAYMDDVISPALAAVNVVLHRVCKSQYATVDLYRNDDLLIPAFTDQSGNIGKLPTFCSNEWKQRAMRRWASKQIPESTEFEVWLGMSTDEMRRVKQPLGKWQNRYPLIEQRMNRGDCLALVASMGWPSPPRSSCWMCPNRGADEWIHLRDNAPDDFSKAITFENEIRKVDDALWLTQSGAPLSEFNQQSANDLFSGRCDSGYCFT